jgi:hypothetical protein
VGDVSMKTISNFQFSIADSELNHYARAVGLFGASKLAIGDWRLAILPE